MSTPALNRSELIQLLDGNPELILTIVDSFLDDCSDYMESIRYAVEEEDRKVLEREAHGLKGAAGSLRANPTTEAAQELEEMGHTDNFSGAESALETLEHEVDRLKEELRSLREECQEELIDE